MPDWPPTIEAGESTAQEPKALTQYGTPTNQDPANVTAYTLNSDGTFSITLAAGAATQSLFKEVENAYKIDLPITDVLPGWTGEPATIKIELTVDNVPGTYAGLAFYDGVGADRGAAFWVYWDGANMRGVAGAYDGSSEVTPNLTPTASLSGESSMMILGHYDGSVNFGGAVAAVFDGGHALCRREVANEPSWSLSDTRIGIIVGRWTSQASPVTVTGSVRVLVT